MTQPRLPDLDPDTLTAAQRPVYEAIVAGPRGQVVGPLRIWLTSPDMAVRAQALGQYARFDSVLPMALSELAILVTGRIWSSGFEWAHHAPLAIGAGISAAAVDRIAQGLRPDLADTAQQAVFDFAVELHRDRQVQDATYSAALGLLGEQGVVDLVAICGYYTLISMTINAFHVPDGEGPKLPPLPPPVTDWFRS